MGEKDAYPQPFQTLRQASRLQGKGDSAVAYPDGVGWLGNHSMVAVVGRWARAPQRNFAPGRSFHCGVIDEGTRSTRVRPAWCLYV